MKPSLQPGVRASTALTVDRERTIGLMGEKARVHAAPMPIRDLDIACRNLRLQHLDPGEGSVGARVEATRRRRHHRFVVDVKKTTEARLAAKAAETGLA